MEIIKIGKDLGTAIKRTVTSGLKWQDKVHALFISAAWHYAEHGDSTYLSMLCREITKVNGVNKSKLIGYVSEVCQVNWDSKKLTFKKAKKSEFKFDQDELFARKWYDFETDEVMSAWQMKKVFENMTKAIEKHESEAREQYIEAAEAYHGLQSKMAEVAQLVEVTEAA
tara:strand:- start:564 stop:1070 length:507 start_codon:yes stop_codon:yes gene_type:complete